MINMESQVRNAFASIEPPEDIRLKTLEAIEAKRGSRITVPADVQKAKAEEAQTANRRGSSKGPLVRKRLRLMVAACLALLLCFGATFAYAAETAQVEIRTDGPTVTLGLNRFNAVRSATVDESHADFAMDLETLLGMQYEDALEALLHQTAAEAPGTVAISVTCGNACQENRINSCNAKRLRMSGNVNGAAQSGQNGQHCGNSGEHGNGGEHGNRYGQIGN